MYVCIIYVRVQVRTETACLDSDRFPPLGMLVSNVRRCYQDSSGCFRRSIVPFVHPVLFPWCISACIRVSARGGGWVDGSDPYTTMIRIISVYAARGRFSLGDDTTPSWRLTIVYHLLADRAATEREGSYLLSLDGLILRNILMQNAGGECFRLRCEWRNETPPPPPANHQSPLSP